MIYFTASEEVTIWIFLKYHYSKNAHYLLRFSCNLTLVFLNVILLICISIILQMWHAFSDLVYNGFYILYIIFHSFFHWIYLFENALKESIRFGIKKTVSSWSWNWNLVIYLDLFLLKLFFYISSEKKILICKTKQQAFYYCTTNLILICSINYTWKTNKIL